MLTHQFGLSAGLVRPALALVVLSTGENEADSLDTVPKLNTWR